MYFVFHIGSSLLMRINIFFPRFTLQIFLIDIFWWHCIRINGYQSANNIEKMM
jgi:hypothetical protein